MALFGLLQLDKGEPSGFAEFLPLLQSWLQDAGQFCAIGLVFYIAYAMYAFSGKSPSHRLLAPLPTAMLVMLLLSLTSYGLWGLAIFEESRGRTHLWGMPLAEPPPEIAPIGLDMHVQRPKFHTELQPLVLMIAGAFAIIGVLIPVVMDFPKWRLRRIYALSKLVFKQASGIKTLWILFLVVGAIPFLFPAQWFFSYRPEDELKVTIAFVAVVVAVLIKTISALMASFALPNDIKNQTIYTVVTKPVERFEIVLGLFFGHVALMTLILAILTAASLVLINANTPNKTAQEQTFKARVPVRGSMAFGSGRDDFAGVNVGREFDYRKYIHGHPQSPQRGIWSFIKLPSNLSSMPNDRVPIEFMFDIFRLTKGKEDRGGSGVEVSLRFVTHNCPQKPPVDFKTSGDGEWKWTDAKRFDDYQRELRQAREQGRNPTAAEVGSDGWKTANELAEKYGIYEISGKPVSNNRVIGVDIPAGLFRNAFQNRPADPNAPLIRVYVKCESAGQMLGMAEPDLYLLAGNQSFTQNYIKAMFGLWCRVCLIVGLAVACSTYLSGVIALLAAVFLFLCGYFTEFIRDVSLNRNIGGGPLDSMTRLMKADLPTGPAAQNTAAKIAETGDQGFAWIMRRFLNLIPDVESFSWTEFVKEGFNVSFEYLIINLLVLIGYLLPWGLLAYYLMKSREIASS